MVGQLTAGFSGQAGVRYDAGASAPLSCDRSHSLLLRVGTSSTSTLELTGRVLQTWQSRERRQAHLFLCRERPPAAACSVYQIRQTDGLGDLAHLGVPPEPLGGIRVVWTPSVNRGAAIS